MEKVNCARNAVQRWELLFCRIITLMINKRKDMAHCSCLRTRWGSIWAIARKLFTNVERGDES